MVLLAVGVAVVSMQCVSTPIANVLMLLVGLFSIAALKAFYQILEENGQKPLFEVHFSENIIASELDMALERLHYNPAKIPYSQKKENPWDIQAEDLLGQDNSLAMAKLRIDMERELRKIAVSKDINAEISRLGVGRLADEMHRSEIIDNATLAAIKDILPVVNQAIHGGEVSTETAASVLNVGRKLITALHLTSEASLRG